jgi:hypothetical protein
MSILFFYIYFEIRKFFMDRQLLKALDNLAFGLEALVDALKEGGAKSDTGTALQAGNFEKSLESITVELKSIKKDTQEILKNQQTIIGLQKQKSSDKKTEELEGASDPKKESQIKKGVSTILLIAVAVLAIGLAFKLVGKVDFFSVISLGLAIYMMSLSFEKVSKLNLSIKDVAIVSATLIMMAVAVTLSSLVMSFIKPIGFGQALTGILILGMFALASDSISRMVETFSKIGFTSLIKGVIFLPIVMVAISIGISMSSWVLQSVVTIGFGQAITAILIAGLFTVISFGIRKLLKAFEGIDMLSLAKSVKFLPIILPAIALGIALSSWVLQLITPIGFGQAITGILIAAMFTVVAFGIEKIIKAIDKVDPEDVILLPIILPAIALAITASSWIMSMITPITFMQFLTAVGIALLFVVISYALVPMMEAIGKIKGSDLIKLPVLFTIMAGAIWLSSMIISKIEPIDYGVLLKILAFSLVIAVSIAAVGIAAGLLGQIGLSKIAKGAISIVILSGAIWASSKILSDGVYDIYPNMGWVLNSGMSLIAFGSVIFAYDKLKIGPVNALKGSLSILIIAGAISLTSHILNFGKYDKYPGVDWALGVGLSLGAFGVGALLLGAMVFGPQAIIFAAGLAAILVVAATITATSKILSKGKYDNPGMLSWAMSTALLYATFAPIILILGTIGVAANAMGAIFGKGANPFEVGRKMILSIAKTIVGVSYILAKGTYKGGPTKEWAEGIAITLGAFAPVYGMLVRSAIFKAFGASGVGPNEFSKAIITVSKGIITAAYYFAQNKAAFKNGPSKEWSEGVGIAIGAFAPVFKVMEKFPFSAGQKISNSMKWVAQAIIRVAKIFNSNKGTFEKGSYPKSEWSSGVGESMNTFRGLISTIGKVDYSQAWKVKDVAWKMVSVAKILSNGNKFFQNKIDPNYFKNMSKNILDFNDIVKKLVASEKSGSKLGSLFSTDPITQVAKRMVTLAKGYDAMATSLIKLSMAMRMLNIKSLTQLGSITKGVISGSNSKIETIKPQMGRQFGQTDGGKPIKESIRKMSTSDRKKNEISYVSEQLEKVVKILTSIDRSTSTIDEYIAEVTDNRLVVPPPLDE